MVYFANRKKRRYFNSCKIVKYNGFKVVFAISPLPSAEAHAMTMSTYVDGIGSFTKAFTCIGMTEAGFRRFPFKNEARHFVKFCLAVASFKDEEYEIIKNVLGVTGTKSMDVAVNGALMKLCREKGFVLQPCGGYSMKDVAESILKDNVRQNAAAPQQPPSEPAKPAATPPPAAVKKQTFH